MKMQFPIESGYELLWVEPAGDGNFYVRNSPFQAYGISFEDKVSGKEVDGQLNFDSVVTRSGRSTYRVFVTGSHGLFEQMWKQLEVVGCTYERSGESLFSIDVPASSDVYEVYSILSDGESKGVWQFEEANLGHQIKPPDA